MQYFLYCITCIFHLFHCFTTFSTEAKPARTTISPGLLKKECIRRKEGSGSIVIDGMGNSYTEAMGNSYTEAMGNSYTEAMGNSYTEAQCEAIVMCGNNHCIITPNCLLDDRGGDHWLPQIGLRSPWLGINLY